MAYSPSMQIDSKLNTMKSWIEVYHGHAFDLCHSTLSWHEGVRLMIYHPHMTQNWETQLKQQKTESRLKLMKH